MSSRLDDLRDLALMLDEGKITQHEYEVVKTEILAAPADEWAPSAVAVATVEPESDVAGEADSEPTEDPESAPADWLTFAKEIPPLYWASVAASLLTVFFGGSLRPMAWITTGVATAALVKVRQPAMRWMAWTGLIVGLAFTAIGLFGSGTAGTVEARPLPSGSSGPQQLDEVPVGSLGIEFGDLIQGWNGVPDPPHILKGISTNPEPGPLDSFLYTFDTGAVLAGAYNPTDGYVYALMAKVNLGDPSFSNFYVHLCYLLYPGTHECFDAYMADSGLYGKTADELSGSGHNSSYQFDGNEWRIEINREVLTLRVLGPRQDG